MMMKNSNSVTPDEYFNYFCTDALAVKHHFSNESGVDALEEHIESLERRVERQEEGLMNYERFVEDLLSRIELERIYVSNKSYNKIKELLELNNIER
jgi:polyhydroxyalkanoate synthesis regulator phasin